MKQCLACGSEIMGKNRYVKKTCSHSCDGWLRYHRFMERWLLGEAPTSPEISEYIVRYFRELYNDQCQRCGWHELNPITERVPLTIHHIDGDYRNNQRENLEILCPNCHSLTSTYGNMNRGSGRPRYASLGQ